MPHAQDIVPNRTAQRIEKQATNLASKMPKEVKLFCWSERTKVLIFIDIWPVQRICLWLTNGAVRFGVPQAKCLKGPPRNFGSLYNSQVLWLSGFLWTKHFWKFPFDQKHTLDWVLSKCVCVFGVCFLLNSAAGSAQPNYVFPSSDHRPEHLLAAFSTPHSTPQQGSHSKPDHAMELRHHSVVE